MKISPFAIAGLSSVLSSSHAIGIKDLVRKVTRVKNNINKPDAASAASDLKKDDGVDSSSEATLVVGKDSPNVAARNLQSRCSDGTELEFEWHPQYGKGWDDGLCAFTKDCDSPGYSSELACCKAQYAGQNSGTCLKNLPNPPTTAPTSDDVYYPDYGTAWFEATCISDRPVPSGRPISSDMLSCCKKNYGGQMSGACLAALPNPPTTSPTNSGGLVDFYYPDYATAWSEATCLNTLPVPPNMVEADIFESKEACCKTRYAGQVSNACMFEPKGPETIKFDFEDGMDGWELEGGTFGRQSSTKIGGSYALFSSSCLHEVCDHVTSPPIIMTSQSTLSLETSFLTEEDYDGGNIALYYDGEYHTIEPSGGRLYDLRDEYNQDDWYNADDEYGIQNYCGDIFEEDTPFWHDESNSKSWAVSNFSPAALGLNLSPEQQKSVKIVVFHATDWEYCEHDDDDDVPFADRNRAYFAFDNMEVTEAILDTPEEYEYWYPDYETAWSEATCLNTQPLPFAPGGRPTYGTKDACCAGAYRNQVSNDCCKPECLVTALIEFDFSTGNDGWSVKGGMFDRENDHGSSGHAMFAHNCRHDTCDNISSPSIMMTYTSSLSLSTSFAVERYNDGAMVSLYYNGEHHIVRPSSGRLYQVSGFYDDDDDVVIGLKESCGFANPGGWSDWAWSNYDDTESYPDDEFIGNPTEWETSTFSSDQLNLPLGPGDQMEVQIYIFHGTDGSGCGYLDDDGPGGIRGERDIPGYFAFDDVQVTDAYLK